MNFDRSKSSSQHSVMARPITLTFSDDDDDDDFATHVESDVDETTTATRESFHQSQNYDSFSTPEMISRTLESSGYTFSFTNV